MCKCSSEPRANAISPDKHNNITCMNSYNSVNRLVKDTKTHYSRAGGKATAGTAMAIPVFEGEKMASLGF